VRPLIDAHTLIWAVDDPSRLGSQAAVELRNLSNQPLLSAGTLWEIAIKVGLGKLTLSLPYRQWMAKAIADLGLSILPITVDYADVQAGLPQHHRDPFDRLIVAQAIVEGISIISADPQLDAYGISRIW
jgi:PIN domain nuclease of toxin-antitoxin system